MTDPVEFAKITAFLASLYPNFRLNRATNEAYYQILADVPAENLWAAVRHLGSQNREFPPSAGTIRQTAFDLAEMATGNTPTAIEAWGQVQQVWGRPLESRIDYVHPLTQRAVEAMGGWTRLGQEPLEMAAATRARFAEVYGVLLKREQEDVRMLPEVRDMIRQIADGMRRLGNGQGKDEENN